MKSLGHATSGMGSLALLLFNCAPLLARDFSSLSLCVICLTIPTTCYLIDETSLASWDFTRSWEDFIRDPRITRLMSCFSWTLTSVNVRTLSLFSRISGFYTTSCSLVKSIVKKWRKLWRQLFDQIRFDRSSIFTNGDRYRDPSSETANYFVGADDTTVCSK